MSMFWGSNRRVADLAGPLWMELFIELCKSRCGSQGREETLLPQPWGWQALRLGEIKNFSASPSQMGSPL